MGWNTHSSLRQPVVQGCKSASPCEFGITDKLPSLSRSPLDNFTSDDLVAKLLPLLQMYWMLSYVIGLKSSHLSARDIHPAFRDLLNHILRIIQHARDTAYSQSYHSARNPLCSMEVKVSAGSEENILAFELNYNGHCLAIFLLPRSLATSNLGIRVFRLRSQPCTCFYRSKNDIK